METCDSQGNFIQVKVLQLMTAFTAWMKILIQHYSNSKSEYATADGTLTE